MPFRGSHSIAPVRGALRSPSRCRARRGAALCALAWAWVATAGCAGPWASLTGTLGLPALVAPGLGAPAGVELEPVTRVEGIAEYALGNGLRVLLVPDASLSTVTVAITYRVGSRHEGAGEGGMAHLLEHMLFKGTPGFPDIDAEFQRRGASANGTTSVDRTNYYETLPASDENLEFALRLEAERMVESPIRAEDLATEMTVVRNEFERNENNPAGILGQRMRSAAYLFHAYGRPTIGNQSDIERVPADALRRFYRRYYQPDNAMLVIAGSFEQERALRSVQQYFGRIPRPERELEEPYTVEPAQDGPRSVVLRRVGGVAVTGALYHVPAGAHPDLQALDVLAQALSDRPGGRLYRALVESGLAAGVGAGAEGRRDPGLFIVQASVAEGQEPEAVQRQLIEEVESVAGSITEEEVQRAVNRRLVGYRRFFSDSRRIALALSEAEAAGDWRLLFIERDRLAEVTAEDVNRVAETYLLPSNRTAGLFIPDPAPRRAAIPARPDVAALVEGYAGSEEVALGEAFEATAAHIEASTQRTAVDGMKLALLPKKTRGAIVRAQIHLGYGTQETLRKLRTPASWMPALMQRGTRELSYQELRDRLDAIEAVLSLGGGAGALRVGIRTTREHLADALRLAAEVVREPSFPASELEILRQQTLTAYEGQRTDPQARMGQALSRALNPFPRESFFYQPTLDERIEQLRALTRNQIAELHERFLGAEHLFASFVGDFDRAEVESVMREAFGGWTSPEPYERIVAPHVASEPLQRTIDTPDKKMAALAIGTVFPMRDDHPDAPALRFANYVLGESPSSRLFRSLREREGLSYSVGSSLGIGSLSDAASFTAVAIAAPENAERARALLREEFEGWLEQPVSDEQLAEFRRGYRERFRRSLTSDASLASALLSDLRLERSFTQRRERLDAALASSLEQLRTALREHLAEQPLVDVVAGDVSAFSGTGEALEEDEGTAP